MADTLAADADTAAASPPRRRLRLPPTVGGRLRALVLAVVLPAMGIALIAALAVYRQARHSVTDGAVATARALSLVIDREHARRADMLRTLAASPMLADDRLAEFHAMARRVAPGPESTIVLIGAEGRQLLNTRVPYEPTAELPISKMAERTRAAPQAQQLVSDLYFAPYGRQHSFSVQVPVPPLDGAAPRYHLAMGGFAAQLQRVFEEQRLPAGWSGTVLDTRGVAVARNVDADKVVGRSASPSMLAAMAGRPEGLTEQVTLTGTPVTTAFATAPASGWRVLIGVPRVQLLGPAVQAVAGVLLASLVLGGLGLWAAARIGRGIAAPVRRLEADAAALGRGEAPADASTGLTETDAVRRALVEADHERRRADERLASRVREAVAESERAQQAVIGVQKLEALGRLTGGIAHDFNNLLQTMTTGLYVASRLATDERARQPLAACERAVAKAVKLTRQLMTFGRSQPGRLEVVDLAQQLPAMRDLLQGALRESIALHIDTGEPAPWPVHVDPVQLELAVLNLAMNARDAMPQGGTVTLTARNASVSEREIPGAPAGDMVLVALRDDGTGIAPEVLPRVFEPFFTTKPVGSGSGLGLAQVYGFARQSGGGAAVASTPGTGTTVTIALPRSRAAAAAEGAAVPPPASGARYAGSVLLVEDDALQRGTTAHALEQMGFTVLVASAAESALALVRAPIAIDAMVSDVRMPGAMDGVQLAHAVRAERPSVRIVLASGYAEVLTGELPYPVVAKPYDVQALARRLATHGG